MSRLWFWLQLVIGWLPIWALYAALIVAAHPPITPRSAAVMSMRAIVPAALLGLGVRRFTQRFVWPQPFRLGFVGVHIIAAMAYSGLWLVVATLSEWMLGRGSGIVPSSIVIPFLVLGLWLYVMVASVSYASQASERAVMAESSAARAQLSALRAQLHPHFLFNALHSVVQLIPREPQRAAHAAELVAELLRTTLEDDQDLVPLAREVALVERYLEIEHIRFGERLHSQLTVDDAASDVLIPSFAIQSLVENAVQHAATPRVAATTIAIAATYAQRVLIITVDDDGDVTDRATTREGAGTGLSRLRERLRALFGTAAELEAGPKQSGGYRARIVIRDRS